MKTKKQIIKLLAILLLTTGIWSCKIPAVSNRIENKSVPTQYLQSRDSNTVAGMNWREFFGDDNLAALIDTALKYNQELNITLQEIQISRNEIQARKGEYLPFVGVTAGLGFEKEARYTRHGAVDEAIEIKPQKEMPKILPDYLVGLSASWELDVWKKLRSARQSAV